MRGTHDTVGIVRVLCGPSIVAGLASASLAFIVSLAALSACKRESTADADKTARSAKPAVAISAVADGAPAIPLAVEMFCASTFGERVKHYDDDCSADDKKDNGPWLGWSETERRRLERCRVTLGEGVAKGRLAFDEAEAPACMTALRAKLSAPAKPERRYDALPECAKVVTGKVAAGGTCRFDLECKAGLVCTGNETFAHPLPTTEGTCSAPVDRGTHCEHRDDNALPLYIGEPHYSCKGGSECMAGDCAKVAKAGEPCAGSVCEGSLVCVLGRCAKTRVPAGGKCNDWPDCAADAYCAKGTCRLLEPAGAACSSIGTCKGFCDLDAKKCRDFCGSG